MEFFRKFYRKDILFIFLLISFSLFWWIIVFYNFQPVDRSDWDQYFAYHEAQRKIIIKYHQFPFWNPYISGGIPCWAHTNSDFLSPYFLFILIFGTIPGTIIIYFFQVFIGLLGMYFLSRHFALDRTLSLLNSIFFLNIFNVLTYVGSFGSLNISFIPWIYLLFNKNKRNVLPLSILIAYLIYAGDVYVFITAFIIIFADVIFNTIIKKGIKSFLFLLNIVSFVFFLVSPKLFPMIELLISYPRITKLPSAFKFLNLNNIWAGILELKYFFFSGKNIYSHFEFLDEEMLGYNFHIITIFLLILGYFLLWRKYKIVVIINIIFLLLILRSNSLLPLWHLLHFFLPSMKDPRNFLGGLITFSALSLGLTLKNMQIIIMNIKVYKLIFFIIFFIISFNIFNNAYKISKGRTIIKYNLANRENNFSQTTGDPRKMFETVYNDQGVVYAHDSFGNQMSTKVIPREYQNYKGEYFLGNTFGNVSQRFFSPNKLIYKVNIYKDDILVINQNYFSGWRSSVGKVINYNGLVGVPIKKGDREITIYYLPTSFIIGIGIFIFGLFYIIHNSRGG